MCVLLSSSVSTKPACDEWSVHASFSFVTLHIPIEGACLWTLVTWSGERERVYPPIVFGSVCVVLEVFHCDVRPVSALMLLAKNGQGFPRARLMEETLAIPPAVFDRLSASEES